MQHTIIMQLLEEAKNMEEYEMLEMEMIVFPLEDIIVTSPGDHESDDL